MVSPAYDLKAATPDVNARPNEAVVPSNCALCLQLLIRQRD